MKLDELVGWLENVRIYGVVVDDIKIGQATSKQDEATKKLTPVLLKGVGLRDYCIAASATRIIMLPGSGSDPQGCGWLAPVRMWTVDRSYNTIAFDVQSGTIDQLCTLKPVSGMPRRPLSEPPQVGGRSASEERSGLQLSEEVARKLSDFLSDENVLNAGWVAHNANNEL